MGKKETYFSDLGKVVNNLKYPDYEKTRFLKQGRKERTMNAGSPSFSIEKRNAVGVLPFLDLFKSNHYEGRSGDSFNS